MPRFSRASLSKLADCHMDLQVIFFEVIKHVDCVVLEGYRNEEEQNRAYEEGKSKLRWPNGKHNIKPSNAVDVAPYPVPLWSNEEDFIYFGGFVMGVAMRLFEEGKITHKLKFGGDWNGTNRVTVGDFKDYLHFEIIV